MKRLSIYLFVATTIIFSCNGLSENIEHVTNEEVALSDIGESDKMVDVEDKKKLIGPVVMKGMKGTNSSTPIKNNNQTEIQKLNNKIIRKGSLSIESNDIQKTKQKLDAVIAKSDGYYEQENTTAGSTYTNINLIIRIPSDTFDSFIATIETGEDKITNKSISTEDVSLQYYDVESRIKSKRIYLEHYQKMVSSAKSVSDLLEIQEQIRQLQEDIDSNETLLKLLSNRIAYSTINIDIFHSSGGPIYSNSYLSEIRESFYSGWRSIKDLFLGLIKVWPILLSLIFILLIWKRYKRLKS